MVLMLVRQGGWIARAVAKDTHGKADKLIFVAMGTIKWAKWQPNRKRKLIFLEDDEELRFVADEMMN
jgi:hypothetical protein